MPPGQKLGFRRCVASKAATMLNDEAFEAKVVGSCPEELRPLIRELHGLFFQKSDDSFAYKYKINPQEFLNICKRQLETYGSEQNSFPETAGTILSLPSALPQLGRRQSPVEAYVSSSGRRLAFSRGVGVRPVHPTAASSLLPASRLLGLAAVNPGRGSLGCRHLLRI